MSIFVTDKKLLEGEVFYIYMKTESGDEKPIPIFVEEEKEKHADQLLSFKVYFRKPNYKIFNTILKDAIVTQFDGTMVTHPTAIREAQLKNLLVKWDIEDEETGKVIPVSPELLDNLHPEIATAILSEYDRLTSAEMDFSDLTGANFEDILQEDLDIEETVEPTESIESAELVENPNLSDKED